MYKKLLSTFFVMTCLMICAGSVFFYYYNYYIHKQYARTSVEQLAQDISSQVDLQIRLLDTLAIDIASNTVFLEAASRLETNSQDLEAEETIRKLLIANYINKYDVYRISMFNESGNLISTSPVNVERSEVTQKIVGAKWYRDTHILSGRKLILPPHEDQWNMGIGQEVISLLRPLKVDEHIIGYIEVQQKAEVIYKMMVKKWNNEFVKTIVLDGDNHIFYQTQEKNIEQERIDRIIENLNWYYYKTIEAEKMIISSANSKFNDWKTIVLLEKTDIHKGLRGIRNTIGIAGVTITGALGILIWICLRAITKPLGEMVKKLEHFSLNTIESFEEVPIYHEIEVVHHALGDMRDRLNQSIKKEKELELLQTKATFEALQAQIGPHFLFNTLGSIANMCEEGENEKAADSCYSLSELLRYSANYKQTIVSLREEEDNLRSYLSLMQGRYRQRLKCEMQIEEASLTLSMPRLTLQPLVENAIKYSLMEHETVCVGVYGRCVSDHVVITIKDNGCGIEQEKIQSICADYEEFVQNQDMLEAKDDIRFGRMGLLGTLIRLYLYYGKQFQYEITNNREGGMCIELTIIRGERDVSSDDCR